MNQGKELNIISKCFLFISIFLLSSIASFAAENLVSGINVEQFPDNEYKVLLKLNKNTQIKKASASKDNLVLVLNSTLPADSMEIIYDNTVDLNNIIVQKKNSDNTVISLQGKNIENAGIYTKELSTGLTKQVDTNNIFNTLFFNINKKSMTILISGILFLLFLIGNSKPKQKKRNQANINKTMQTSKHISANTLRNKNMMQKRNIPSIGYKTNGSFNSANAYITAPADLVVNGNQYYEEEQIRKAG